ncbi:uncharacterized protein [Medicago truncatula]|uniref:DUF674 family protein n=1 Tax=Medicago truncatula TaxID=3880 RepID=A0A072U0X6_MEDTR|nr:uncharacterized protein LOC25498672 [Medicago truncatula]KEH23086.1 DUF674 family protein [Medicago truncatula]
MAAGNLSESVEQGDEVTLRVMVDKEINKVVYAEAGKDFVDALFSFLTLPLGTISRLVAKESDIEAVRFGSLSTLYQSVSDLDEHYLWSNTCKEMLLNPRNSMEAYCQQLKLNIDDTPAQYFTCKDWQSCRGFINGSRVTTYRNQKCICGRLLNKAASVKTDLTPVANGFVKETATFIIRDDLCVIPNDLGTSLHLLQTHGLNDIADVEKKTLVINKKEVVDLLKLSLHSKTPLTDFIFKKEKILGNSNPTLRFRIGNGLPSDSNKGMKNMIVKVFLRKSKRKILFATADEDFADFLFSFLTFPMGGVLQMLEGFSSLSCIDILYKSMTELNAERCLTSQELKNKLTKPRIFANFELKNQILPIGTCPLTCTFDSGEPAKLVDPKSSLSGGYIKGPLTIMVTDDLVVTPMSSIDAVSYLERMKVPLNDVEEIFISIGVEEGLSILKASLTSTSALTNGLKQYIGSTTVHASLSSRAASTDIPLYNLKKPKEEKEA